MASYSESDLVRVVLCRDIGGGVFEPYEVTGGGGGSLIVQEGDVTVSSSATTLDFGAGFDLTESPAGEVNISLDLSEYSGADLPVSGGGTGAGTAADARTNLGLVIGTDVASASSISDHIADTSAAHAASAISADSTTLAGVGTDVQAVLEELDNSVVDHAALTTSVHGIANTANLYAAGGTDVAVADGGTGASTAAGARTNLDVPSNAEAVLDTIFDAKGDILTATAADTPARLAVGTNGQVLTADSAEATGLKWASAGAGATALDDLSDVTITTPATGATLVYNGAAWVDGQLDLADADAVTGILPDANVASTIARDSEVVLQTLADAKGDIVVATAADTFTRLAVGAQGTALIADSGEASGTRWGYTGRVVADDTGVIISSSSGWATETTSTSMLGATESLPANTLAVGDMLLVRAAGRLTNNSGAGATYTLKLSLGGSSLTMTTASLTSSANNRLWVFDCFIWVEALGALGASILRSSGTWEITSAGTASYDGLQATSSNIVFETAVQPATTSTIAFDLQMASSTTTDTQTAEVAHFTVVHIPRGEV